MNYHDDLSPPQSDSLHPIPRVPNTSNFSELFHKSKLQSDKSKRPRSRSRAVTDGSENSQILCMAAPKRSKRLNHSLSSITNGSGRELDGSSDFKPDLEDDILAEDVSWDVIDREIFEWQYVCRTGRPYWWSPESKYSRLRRLQPRLSDEPNPRIRMRELEDGPNPSYDVRRHAVSDSYLADPNTVQDMAQLVAIQLLGACFTFPPNHAIDVPSPNYTTLVKDGSANLPDPPMISSLRMHTQFRYSPSFGYQARNTSPVQLWSGRCDGQSPGIQTPVIATSEPSSRRRRVHRALHVTEGSTGSGSLDDLDPAVAATAWYRRQGFHDSNSRKFIVPRLPGRGNRNYQSPTGKYPRYRPPTTPVTSTREDEEIDTSEVYCGVHNSQSIKTNYRLQPVIRSEPHHVFVQPVRELVVKRWRTFRRRFGGSLHSPLPDGMSEDLASTTSGSGLSGASSPAMSSDGKTRRLRAQEGCNIYSSLDSTMHYNSPANGYITTNESAINESLNLELVEPLAAAAALAVAEGRALSPSSQDLVSKPPHPSSSSETLFPSRNQSRAVSGLVPDATPESGVLIPSNANSNSSTPSFSARRAQKRQRRKSMLSEVCTPGDFHSGVAADAKCHLEPVDRSAPSGVRSALAAAREEAELPWNNRTQPQVHETISTPGPTSMRHTAGPSVQRRPRLMRMSTSGTQIFSPSEDGVELDGLPVGPDKEMWRGKGKRRERTYL